MKAVLSLPNTGDSSSDDEDAVSMAMSSVTRLMERCKLDYADIGRLEVGTESQVDRAKSIKSFLMALFEEEGLALRALAPGEGSIP